MSDPLFDTSDGNTPIDEDEALGLRLTLVRTRGDLNEAEAANILDARRAIRSPAVDEVLDDLWLRQLHQRPPLPPTETAVTRGPRPTTSAAR